MADEKNGVKNGTPNAEMAPQEKDGTKVPLTSDDPSAEVKFTTNTSPNGDAKIDVGAAQTYSGLTKEELMKYNNDPFWVRLRWFLFILFWVAWLLMLVMAIVIIVQAERCEPPPELDWIQESPMIEYESSDTSSADDLMNVMKTLGISSAYMPLLMDKLDFGKLSGEYKDSFEGVREIVEKSEVKIVTDFIPRTIDSSHPWIINETYIIENTQNLDFENKNLTETLKGILKSWIDKAVTGFLTDDANVPGMNHTINDINIHFEESKGVVAGDIVEITDIAQFADARSFKEYLEQTDVWKYFKYNPTAGGSQLTESEMNLITFGLFMVPGTPILQGGIKNVNVTENIKRLIDFRETDAIKFGRLSFANTTENVVAFTRIQQGTPGYAVVLNFYENKTENIDFSSIYGIGDSGTIKFRVNGEDSPVSKVSMNNIQLNGYEGLLLQFVPSFG